MILNAFKGKPMPIYGRGENVRDWLFVDDHARALSMILRGGQIGDCYNVGASNERRNIDMAGMICDLVDELAQPLPGRKPRRALITFVADRPGHDSRYAIDARKIREQLGWKPQETLESALRRTVEWYLARETGLGV
jgi:dTDP-glucose 4,6-dehydratase